MPTSICWAAAWLGADYKDMDPALTSTDAATHELGLFKLAGGQRGEMSPPVQQAAFEAAQYPAYGVHIIATTGHHKDAYCSASQGPGLLSSSWQEFTAR